MDSTVTGTVIGLPERLLWLLPVRRLVRPGDNMPELCDICPWLLRTPVRPAEPGMSWRDVLGEL